MYKSIKYSGIPIISQVINLIDSAQINRTAQENQSERYYKRFKTKDHVKTIIYVVLSGCNSLREITSIMLAWEGKINQLSYKDFPSEVQYPMQTVNGIAKYFWTYILVYTENTEIISRTAE